MNYDFDTLIDRRGTHSLKWSAGKNELPMWVADMDFAAAPEITAAIKARAASGLFGYSIVPDEWYEAVCGWWRERHGFAMEKDWLVFASGVVPILSSVIRKLTTPGENVLVMTPVYGCFFSSIRNNGRRVLESPLAYDGAAYRIDWEDLERKLADPQTALLLLCNPHNPTGNLWSRETLARIGELCWTHHVLVLSDEIHCDLTDPGRAYVPFASVSAHCMQNSVTCLAPTKAFNLAGLQTAAAMAPDPTLRHKVWRALNTDEIAEPNAFAIDAAIAAFTQGGAWLDALREHISAGKALVREFLAAELTQLSLVPSQATYLLWLDCGKAGWSSQELARHIRNETGLWLSPGAEFGGNGDRFLRMNIACPRKRLTDGLARLQKGVRSYEAFATARC